MVRKRVLLRISVIIPLAWALFHPAGVRATQGAGVVNDAFFWQDPGTGVAFVRIAGGEFEMGSALHDNEKPVHRVRVDEFWMGKAEVTQAQWLLVMGSRPSARRECDDCPVERVSWTDVQRFLDRTGYRLPTEAEWECAGGGADHQRWAGTNDALALGDDAWYRNNSMRRTHPVCQKRPNLFGLCDMTGNVYEWCADWYDENYYRASPPENPAGPASGSRRAARGGSWVLDPGITGITLRLPIPPADRHPYLGFRVALRAAPTPAVAP